MLPDVICLAGPTASGKTAIALMLVQALRHERRFEIISVDSALVYRGMDVGTAKPDAAQRAAVVHHLIDIIEPSESYSAARFVADTQALIAQIKARGACALLVGGTMLYFKALFDGLDALPGADPALRSAIDARAAQLGWPAMHAELARVDPVTAARLAPGDAQRIQRALEVHRLAGAPLSALHGTRSSAPFKPLLIALEPKRRAWLHERIATRLDDMARQGLVDEVRALRARGDLHADLPAMRCVGYRQVWQALDRGEPTESHERGPTPAWRDTALAATRQLAKRQLTWLRSMPQRHSVACDGPEPAAQVLHSVRSADA